MATDAESLLKTAGAVHAQFARMVSKRDSLLKVLAHLDSVTTEALFIEDPFER